MTPKELKAVLLVTCAHRLPVLIKGAPGVGKSDIVNQVCKELDMDMVLMHPVVSDPCDFKGQPWVVDGEALFLPYGDLKQLMTAEKPTIAFLDDIGQAPAVVQAAAMQLILARQVNGHKISDDVVFLAATNRREDRAGVTGILEPVKSRFASIIELEPDVDEWIEWAFDHDMPAELIGFAHFRPALLHSGKATSDIVNHPCPRTFAAAGRLIKAGLTGVEVLGGALGEGCAVELVGFMRVFKSLPNIAGIILDPEHAKVPEEPAALYAVASALVERISKDNIPQILKYAKRLPAEFSVMLVRDAIRSNPEIESTKAFIKWAVAHKDILL